MSTYTYQTMDKDHIKTEMEEELLFSNPLEIKPWCPEDLPTLKMEPLSAEQGEFYDEITIKEEPLVWEEEAGQFVLEKEEVEVTEVKQEYPEQYSMEDKIICLTETVPSMPTKRKRLESGYCYICKRLFFDISGHYSSLHLTFVEKNLTCETARKKLEQNETVSTVDKITPCGTDIEMIGYCSKCKTDSCNIEIHRYLKLQFKINSCYFFVCKGLMFEITHDKCPICKKTFSDTINTCHHIQEAHLRKDSSLSLESGHCNICKKKYENLSMPCEHEKVTQYVYLNALFKIEGLKCPVCLKHFITLNKLHQHIQNTHFRNDKLYLISKTFMYSQVQINQEINIVYNVSTASLKNEEMLQQNCCVFLKSQRHNKTVDDQVRQCDANLKPAEECPVCTGEWFAATKKWLEMQYKVTNKYFYVTGGLIYEIIDNKCSICKQMFGTPIDACQHIKQVHLKKDTRLQNGEGINEISNLDLYCSIDHEKLRNYLYSNTLFEIEDSKCPLCPTCTFSNRSGVCRHVRTLHFQDKILCTQKLHRNSTNNIMENIYLGTQPKDVNFKQLQYATNINKKQELQNYPVCKQTPVFQEKNVVSTEKPFEILQHTPIVENVCNQLQVTDGNEEILCSANKQKDYNDRLYTFVPYFNSPQTAASGYEQPVIPSSTITSEIPSQNQQSVPSRKTLPPVLSQQNTTKKITSEKQTVGNIMNKLEVLCVPRILRKRSHVLENGNETANKIDMYTNTKSSNTKVSNTCHQNIDKNCDVANNTSNTVTDFTSDVQNDVNMINFSSDSDIFKHICPLCSQTFSYDYQLKNHISCQNSKLWDVQICRYCRSNSCWVKYLRKYLYSLRCKEAIHYCGDDHFSVKRIKYLSDYFEQFGFLCGKLRFNNKIYCKICCLTFMYKNDLLVHLNIHMEKKKNVCKKCHKDFTGCYFLDKLVAILSTENEGVMCLICNQSYKNENLLEQHRRIMHTVQIYPCNNKKSKLKLEPVKHKYYNCDMCTVRFLGKEDLEIHMKLSHLKLLKKYTFDCKFCLFKCLKSQHLLYKHVIDKHIALADDTICKICKKYFTTVKHLREHEEQCLHKKKMKQFKSSQCGKTAEKKTKKSTSNISCVRSDLKVSSQHRDKLKLVKPCSVLLDRTKVSRYLCPETGLHKYSPAVEGGPQECKRPRLFHH